MASFWGFVGWSLALVQSAVSPDEKSLSKLYMYIYILNYWHDRCLFIYFAWFLVSS